MDEVSAQAIGGPRFPCLHTLDTLLSAHRFERTFLAARVWKVSFSHPGQLFNPLPFSPPKMHSSGGSGGPNLLGGLKPNILVR